MPAANVRKLLALFGQCNGGRGFTKIVPMDTSPELVTFVCCPAGMPTRGH